VKVTRVLDEGGRVTGVEWQAGDETGVIAAEHVVNCGGMWGRDLAASSGVTLPLHACEHFYLVTEPVAGLSRLPVLRVPDECAYYKEDAGKMMLGAFEPVAKPWGMAGIPEDFSFDSLPEDFAHFEPILEEGDEPDADVPDGGHPHLLQRPRKLHPRRPLLSGRGAGTARLLGGGGLQLGRHRVVGRGGHGAGALDHRPARRPSICGRWTSAAPSRSSATAATCANG
jgi:glycine/D-amino acid oxidase-like deaminating enzyme